MWEAIHRILKNVDLHLFPASISDVLLTPHVFHYEDKNSITDCMALGVSREHLFPKTMKRYILLIALGIFSQMSTA